LVAVEVFLHLGEVIHGADGTLRRENDLCVVAIVSIPTFLARDSELAAKIAIEDSPSLV
jgi:hypothetical protein